MLKQIHIIFLICTLITIIFSGCVTSTEEKEALAIALNEASIAQFEAWGSLYENDWDTAESAFRENINKKLLLGAAFRGMAIVDIAKESAFGVYGPVLQAIENEPESPYTIAMLKFVYAQSKKGSVQYDALIAALAKAEKQKHVPDWAKREYREILFSCYADAKGLFEESQEIKAKMNILDNWFFLGPFSNVSGAGFKTDFIDINPEGDSIYSGYDRGVNNWEIKPFNVKVPNPGLDTPVLSYFSNRPYSSVYAHKLIYVDKPGEYMFVFGRSGSIELWFDGEKLLEEGGYVKSDNAFYIQKHLDAGTHTIYVKMNNLDEVSSFRVAMSPFEPSDIEISKTYTEMFPDKKYFDPLINAICLDMDQADNSGEGRFWLSYMLHQRGWHERALTVIEENSTADSMLFEWLRARVLLAFGDASSHERIMLDMSDDKPFFAPAREYALSNYLSNDRFEKAEAYLKELDEEYGSWIHTLEGKLMFHLKKDEQDEALAVYRKIKEIHGEPTASAAFMMYRYGKDLSYNKVNEYLTALSVSGFYKSSLAMRYKFYLYRNYPTAYNLLSEYTALYSADDEIWKDYLELIFNYSAVPYETARDKAKDLVSSFPYSYGLLSEQYVQARSVYNNFLSYTRENSTILTASASSKFSEEMGNVKDLYKNSLEKIVAYFPRSIEWRDELRKLNEKPQIKEDIEPRDSHTIIEEYEAENFDTAESDAVVVYDNRKEIFFGDGASSIFQHYILKVLTPRGVGDNRFLYLEFHPAFGSGNVREAFLLKEDGSRIYADRSGRKLAFPGLAAGDYIVLRYEVDSYVTGDINNEIWTSCSLASGYPIYSKDFQLIVPQNKEIKTRVNNIDSSMVDLSEDIYLEEFKRFTVTLRDIPRIQRNAFSPQWRDVVPWIDFSSVASWGRIVDWYKKLYLGQTEQTHGLERITHQLIEDTKTQEEKLRRIFDYVSGGIEYEDLDFQYSNYVPQTADSVLIEGYGDCKDQSVLLIAMLKIAGIESHIVLNTPDYNGANPFLPSPRFSHAIVAAAVNDKILYLDPTTRYFTYNEVPADMIGSYILPITEGGQLARLESDTTGQRTYYMLELDNILQASTVTGSVSYQGIPAGIFRSRFKDLGMISKRNFFSLLSNTWLPGFILDNWEVNNLDHLDYDPVLTFSGTVPGLVSPALAGSYNYSTPWINLLDESVKAWLMVPENQDDIMLNYPKLSTPHIQTVVAHIPSGYRISHVPSDERYSYEDSYVEYKYSKQENTVICTREILIQNQRIPAGKADDFRSFIRKAIFKEDEGVYFRR